MILRHIQLRQNVGQHILLSMEDRPIKFTGKIFRGQTMVLLKQSPLELQVQLAPAHGLGKEVRDASLVFHTNVRL